MRSLEMHMIFAIGQLQIAFLKRHHMRLNMRSDQMLNIGCMRYVYSCHVKCI